MLKIFDARTGSSGSGGSGGAWQGLDAWNPVEANSALLDLVAAEPVVVEPVQSAAVAHRPPAIKTIAFCGAAGGVGKTSLAINVAFELATAGFRVAVLDLDVANPNLLATLNQDAISPGLAGVKRLVGQSRFTIADLDRLLMVLNFDGVRISVMPGLPAPATPAERDELASVAAELLEASVSAFDYVLIDLPAFEAAPMLSTVCLELADASFVVCGADPIGVQRFLWLKATLQSLGLPNEPQVLVNGVRDSVLGSNAKRQLADTIERLAQTEVTAFVPQDQAGFDAALRGGLPLSLAKKGSPARHAISMFVRQGLLEQRTKLDWRVARNG